MQGTAFKTVVSRTAQQAMSQSYSQEQAQHDAVKVIHDGLFALLSLPMPVEVEQQVQMIASAIGDATRAGFQTGQMPAVREAALWGAARKIERVKDMILEAGGGIPELSKCCPDCGTDLVPSILRTQTGQSSLELHCPDCHYSAPRKIGGQS